MVYLLDDAEAHIRALASLHSVKPRSSEQSHQFAELLQRIQFARINVHQTADLVSLHAIVNQIGESIRELAELFLDRQPD